MPDVVTSGRLVDRAGDPIAGAVLHGRWASWTFMGTAFARHGSVTDATGRFELRELVDVDAEMHLTASRGDEGWWIPDAQQPVAGKKDQTVQAFGLTRVTVRVEPSGRPTLPLALSLRPREHRYQVDTSVVGTKTVALAEGTYDVFACPGHDIPMATGVEVHVRDEPSAPPQVIGIDWRPHFHAVRGTVTDDAGQPVRGARLRYSIGPRTERDRSIASDGSGTIRALLPKTASRLLVEKEGFVSQPLTDVTDGFKVTLQRVQ